MLETKPEDFGFKKKRGSEVVLSKRMYQHQAVATTATRVSGALLHRMHWFRLVNQLKIFSRNE
jgi:hypothetical protein